VYHTFVSPPESSEILSTRRPQSFPTTLSGKDSGAFVPAPAPLPSVPAPRESPGAARFAAAVHVVREGLADGSPPLVLFSGDAFSPSLMSAVTKGLATPPCALTPRAPHQQFILFLLIVLSCYRTCIGEDLPIPQSVLPL